MHAGEGDVLACQYSLSDSFRFSARAGARGYDYQSMLWEQATQPCSLVAASSSKQQPCALQPCSVANPPTHATPPLPAAAGCPVLKGTKWWGYVVWALLPAVVDVVLAVLGAARI